MPYQSKNLRQKLQNLQQTHKGNANEQAESTSDLIHQIEARHFRHLANLKITNVRELHSYRLRHIPSVIVGQIGTVFNQRTLLGALHITHGIELT